MTGNLDRETEAFKIQIQYFQFPSNKFFTYIEAQRRGKKRSMELDIPRGRDRKMELKNKIENAVLSIGLQRNNHDFSLSQTIVLQSLNKSRCFEVLRSIQPPRSKEKNNVSHFACDVVFKIFDGRKIFSITRIYEFLQLG